MPNCYERAGKARLEWRAKAGVNVDTVDVTRVPRELARHCTTTVRQSRHEPEPDVSLNEVAERKTSVIVTRKAGANDFLSA